jgi:hypothetical protein
MVAKGTTKKRGEQPKPEGQLRQSQLITSFGPGAMVDLVERAVVIGGLEHWGFSKDGFVTLDDPRLRRSLIPRLKALDPDLDLAREGYFRMPPDNEWLDANTNIGVRALEFPRWFVCQGCHRLAQAGVQFENKNGRYRHQCEKNKWARAVPVRFVVACPHGHLADFPWISFCHMNREEGPCERPELYLFEGATGDFGKIYVECKNCEARQSMSQAMFLPYPCGGERPWLGGRAMNESCNEKMKLLVRTASHAYFAQVVSALRLPDPEPDPLQKRLQQKEVWKAVHKVTSVDELAMLAKLQDIVADAVQGYSLDKVLQAIEKERGSQGGVIERPLRSAEYERLISASLEQPGIVPEPDTEFAAYRIPESRIKLPKGVKGLVIVPELREIRVQVSFSRFDSVSANLQGEYDFDRYKVKPAVLTLPAGNEKWLPAAEIRGEGIFIELDVEAVQQWERSPVVQQRAEKLLRGFESDERAAGEFPGVRFYLLHSLSHLLLTAISLECGYAASAIRERIYCGHANTEGADMAAILLSTGTTGSEGTLGGLVEEGRRLRHHLREAWDLGRLCSNDPVCAAHDPSSESSDQHTEGAACHGCLYVAECSCERFNRYLDRALVVPTIGNPKELAFFQERP